MLKFDFKRPGRLALGVVVAAAALTLAACGGGHDDGPGTTTPPVTTTPTNPGVTVDSFLAIVKNLIATQTSDTNEPSTITDVTATTSDTAEPDPNI
jgi:hypothetical protein